MRTFFGMDVPETCLLRPVTLVAADEVCRIWQQTAKLWH
jgi:hypothetical protein